MASRPTLRPPWSRSCGPRRPRSWMRHPRPPNLARSPAPTLRPTSPASPTPSRASPTSASTPPLSSPSPPPSTTPPPPPPRPALPPTSVRSPRSSSRRTSRSRRGAPSRAPAHSPTPPYRSASANIWTSLRRTSKIWLQNSGRRAAVRKAREGMASTIRSAGALRRRLPVLLCSSTGPLPRALEEERRCLARPSLETLASSAPVPAAARRPTRDCCNNRGGWKWGSEVLQNDLSSFPTSLLQMELKKWDRHTLRRRATRG